MHLPALGEKSFSSPWRDGGRDEEPLLLLVPHPEGHTSIHQSQRGHSQYLRMPKGQEGRAEIPGGIFGVVFQGALRYKMHKPLSPSLAPWGPAALLASLAQTLLHGDFGS